MKESILAQKSIDFSVCAIRYTHWLQNECREYVLSKQILRSSTSIGANIHEAIYAISKADFIAKMQIALKEASETEYWLILLQKSNLLPPSFLFLMQSCQELKAILISTLRTSKSEK